MRGIDVSYVQGTINWAKARDEGDVGFAIVRAVGVGKKQDVRWLSHVAGARAAGLPVGAYLYLDFTDPVGQAKAAKAALDAAGIRCRVFVDIENGKGRPPWTAAHRPVEQARLAVDALQKLGIPAGLYTYPNFLSEWKLDKDPFLRTVPYWAADYNRKQTLPRDGDFEAFVWQYGSSLVLGAGDSQVDVNRFLGSPDQIDEFLAGTFPLDNHATVQSSLADWATTQAALHVHEDPPGSNRQPYAKIAGHANGHAWCMTFVYAGARVTGTVGVPNTAGTLAAIATAKVQKRWHDGLDGLQRGDVVFRLRSGGGHVEIALGPVVTKNGSKVFPSVGGNTSKSGEVNWNGGEVVQQERSVSGWIGYLRPDPSPLVVPSSPVGPTTTLGDDMPVLVKVTGEPEFWLTDLLTKRTHIPTPSAAAEFVKIGVRAQPNGAPFELRDPQVIAGFKLLPQG